MSPRPPLPEPWRSALEPKGVTSKRGLATHAGISPQTASRLIDGVGRPAVETVAAVADALFAGQRDRVWALAGMTVQDHGSWDLPPEASLLDDTQRAAVMAVIRAMVPAEARHLSPTSDTDNKVQRRGETEPTVADVREAQLRAVANEGDAADTEVVEGLARKSRRKQTGEEP